MKTLYFEVRLKTDIILNQKAASEGPNATLDFIPGNNFLGIVAAAIYKNVTKQEAFDLFHNGKVRFGDAHLASPATGARTLKVPACMFSPKLDANGSQLYISHLADMSSLRSLQLKQKRDGFYDFTTPDGNCPLANIRKHFAIKSAHDRENRKSLDEAMYGYESLQRGKRMLFSVEVDEEALCPFIVNALTDATRPKRIGRSRSAQYGLVEIRQLSVPYAEVKSESQTGNSVVVYADARLIFLDEETGMPTFRPNAQQLGLEAGAINWEKSQVRTFQYAPWNAKRQCFEADRCGIEKGSVFVIEGAVNCPSESIYVGSYCNEGFGRVIYNPAFLKADTKGLAKCRLQDGEIEEISRDTSPKILPVSDSDTLLVKQLKVRREMEFEQERMLSVVNGWVIDHLWQFRGERFASQWGSVRSIATQCYVQGRESQLYDLLFDAGSGYLRHGVAAENWSKKSRLKDFQEFVEKGLCDFNERNQCLAVINLAAQMAKQNNQ